MKFRISILISIFMWILSSLPAIAYAETGMGEIHETMAKMMRDCETLSQDLKEMFGQLEKMEVANDDPQQTAEVQKHQEMMRRLLHEMTVHMEAEVKMLEETKASGLWHDRHHLP